MKRIATVIALVVTSTLFGSCYLPPKGQVSLIIPLLETQIQFVPVSPEALSGDQIYFMEDWAEWDSPDDRGVFYLGKGESLTKIQLQSGYRITPGVFSQDCTKYYAGVSDLDGNNFKLSVIDFLAGTLTRLDAANFPYVITPGVTGSFGTFHVGTQHYKLNTSNGITTSFITDPSPYISWSTYSGGFAATDANIYLIDSNTGAKSFVKALPFAVNSYYLKDHKGREFAIFANGSLNELRMSTDGTTWETITSKVGYLFYDSEQHVFMTRVNEVTNASETWYVKDDGTVAKLFPEKDTSYQVQNFCRKGVF